MTCEVVIVQDHLEIINWWRRLLENKGQSTEVVQVEKFVYCTWKYTCMWMP